MKRTNLEMLKTIALALGSMCDQVVFVGGSTVDLYSTNPGAPRARPTLDVDCIVGILSRAQFNEFEEALRSKGFVNDMSEGAPICRWYFQDVPVDIMPTRSDALGFTNEWYEEGIRNTLDFSLEKGLLIKTLSTPYFFSTKLSALKQRGMADLRTSKDFEDIVYVLRNRTSVVPELHVAAENVKAYLVSSFDDLLSLDIIDEAIAAVLDYGEPLGTARKVRAIMEQIR